MKVYLHLAKKHQGCHLLRLKFCNILHRQVISESALMTYVVLKEQQLVLPIKRLLLLLPDFGSLFFWQPDNPSIS